MSRAWNRRQAVVRWRNRHIHGAQIWVAGSVVNRHRYSCDRANCSGFLLWCSSQELFVARMKMKRPVRKERAPLVDCIPYRVAPWSKVEVCDHFEVFQINGGAMLASLWNKMEYGSWVFGKMNEAPNQSEREVSSVGDSWKICINTLKMVEYSISYTPLSFYHATLLLFQHEM